MTDKLNKVTNKAIPTHPKNVTLDIVCEWLISALPVVIVANGANVYSSENNKNENDAIINEEKITIPFEYIVIFSLFHLYDKHKNTSTKTVNTTPTMQKIVGRIPL